MIILKSLFSVTNTTDKKYKVIRIIGFKIKIKRDYCSRVKPQSFLLDFSKVQCIENNYFCTGCSACKNICPSHAITMQENSEFFLVPVIQKEKCTNRGLCNTVCPVINLKSSQEKSNIKCATQVSDKMRKESSSGIFRLLAREFLNNDGYVCAAQYSDYYSVDHVVINDISKLPDLLPSKYTQSTMRTIFSEIKELLNSGKRVLFSGTPCQAASLKAYLAAKEVKYDQDEIIQRIKFGLKGNDENSSALEISTNKRKYKILNEHCEYEQAHCKGLSTNKICSYCPYDSLYREGGLTIGDFGEVRALDTLLDENKGTSLVLETTDKGKYLINLIKKYFKLLKEVPIEQIFSGNNGIIIPIRHNNRNQLFLIRNLCV